MRFIRSNKILNMIIFLAGFVGLGSESLYLKLFDVKLGSAPLVAFMTVSVFILGNALGSFFAVKIKKPWKVELVLCAYALFWFFGHSYLRHLTGPIFQFASPWLGVNGTPAFIAFILLVVPCFCLGVNFPNYCELTRSSFRTFLIYSMGAATGLIAIEAFLYPFFGLLNSLIVIASIHLILMAFLFGVEFAAKQVQKLSWISELFFVGVTTGATQSLFIFISWLLFEQRYYIVGTVILSMVIGHVIGSLIQRRWQIPFLRVIQWIVFGSLGTQACLFLILKTWQLHLYSVTTNIIICMTFILPTAIPIGALFTSWMQNRFQREVASSANISISIGNFLGLIFLSCLLIVSPVHYGFILINLGLLLIIGPKLSWRWKFAMLVVVFLPLFLISEEDIIGQSLPLRSDVKIEKIERGLGEVSAIVQFKRNFGPQDQIMRILYQTGRSSLDVDRNSESISGAVSAAYSPRLDRALVIGAGSGCTAGMIARFFKHTDVIDISTTQNAILSYLKNENSDLLSNPNVHFIQMDGILAAEMLPVVSPEKYDLIVLSTSPAAYQLSAKLFTADFFTQMQSLLKPDGVFTSWGWSELGDDANQIMLNTGKSVFLEQKYYVLEAAPQFQKMIYYLMIYGQKSLEFKGTKILAEIQNLPSDLKTFLNESEESHLAKPLQFSSSKEINTTYRPRFEMLFSNKYFY